MIPPLPMGSGRENLAQGIEWVVEAFGCRPDALASRAALETLFERVVHELGLKPVAPALWHVFPPPSGVTGMLLLSESHLTCHTFPETGYAAFNLYCCRPRPAWPFADRLAEALGARAVEVRTLRRGGSELESSALDRGAGR